MNDSPFYLLYMKKGPFTEEEDQIIILCLTKATSPNMSDVMRKASILLDRSFSSVYQRYLTMGKPTLESLKKQKEEFEDWKLIISFLYNEPIKSWVTQYNYTNLFKKDWELLIDLVEKIEKIYDNHHGYFGVHIHSNCCNIQGTNLHLSLKSNEYGYVYMTDPNAIYSTKKESTYYACVEFIKWYNKHEK